MILAVDVDYRADDAFVAGALFNDWKDESPEQVVYSKVPDVEDYESGQFYKREMPCIMQLLKDHNLSPKYIVIDGFVYLGQESTPGLGMHLYEALDNKIPIIGVAKRAFKDSNTESEILRGKSQNPLYVTSVGVDNIKAKEYILSMHGEHRLPTLLKLIDRECRKS